MTSTNQNSSRISPNLPQRPTYRLFGPKAHITNVYKVWPTVDTNSTHNRGGALLRSHPHTSVSSIYQTWRCTAPCRNHMYQIRGNASSPSVDSLRTTTQTQAFVLSGHLQLVPTHEGCQSPRFISFRCNVMYLKELPLLTPMSWDWDSVAVAFQKH